VSLGCTVPSQKHTSKLMFDQYNSGKALLNFSQMHSRSPSPQTYGQAVLQKLIFHLPVISLLHSGNLLIVYLLKDIFLNTTQEKKFLLQQKRY